MNLDGKPLCNYIFDTITEVDAIQENMYIVVMIKYVNT